MQFIKTWALVICSTLAISVTANAEVGKYPNVTLVAVNEINRDWVKIGLLGSGSEGQSRLGEDWLLLVRDITSMWKGTLTKLIC